MQMLVDHFRDGGWGMYPTISFGAILLAVAVRYATAPERRLVPLLLGLGTLTMAVSALGFVSGVIVTCRAVAADSDHLRDGSIVAIVGFGESLNNIAFALVFVVLAALATSYGAFRLSKLPDGNRPALERA